jgi:hypothetical protein
MFLNGKRQSVRRCRYTAMPELSALIVNDGNVRVFLRDIKTGKSRHGLNPTGCCETRGVYRILITRFRRRDKSMWTAPSTGCGF